MRGYRELGVAHHVDRAGLALLLAMVLFAGSLATALSATAAEKGRSGDHGKSSNRGNSGSHGKPDDPGSQGQAGSEDDSGSHGNAGGNKPDDVGPGAKGNGNGKAKGKGKGKGLDPVDEPELPDEDGDGDGDGGGDDGDGGGDQVLGSRLVRTRVTLTWRNGAFRGKVSSRRNRCEVGRIVNVKRRNGTLIGRDKTNRDGRFVVPARKQTGRFKARAGRKVYRVPARDLRVVCLADRSLLRIRATNN